MLALFNLQLGCVSEIQCCARSSLCQSSSAQVRSSACGIVDLEKVKHGHIGIMGTIFDGIQRPLEHIYKGTKDVFVPRGVDVPCLDRAVLWDFKPTCQVGDLITGGDILGTVRDLPR
jgi:vacuolar-type H+-ATPase catalytic subunit A/Vma1